LLYIYILFAAIFTREAAILSSMANESFSPPPQRVRRRCFSRMMPAGESCHYVIDTAAAERKVQEYDLPLLPTPLMRRHYAFTMPPFLPRRYAAYANIRRHATITPMTPRHGSAATRPRQMLAAMMPLRHEPPCAAYYAIRQLRRCRMPPPPLPH
jgi:hypothetical protein